VGAVVGNEETIAEVGDPFLHLVEWGKRDGQDPGIESNQFLKDVGLMQLHQVLGSEHSGEVPQEH
jgi:hypothetical protein